MDSDRPRSNKPGVDLLSTIAMPGAPARPRGTPSAGSAPPDASAQFRRQATQIGLPPPQPPARQPPQPASTEQDWAADTVLDNVHVLTKAVKPSSLSSPATTSVPAAGPAYDAARTRTLIGLQGKLPSGTLARDAHPLRPAQPNQPAEPAAPSFDLPPSGLPTTPARNPMPVRFGEPPREAYRVQPQHVSQRLPSFPVEPAASNRAAGPYQTGARHTSHRRDSIDPFSDTALDTPLDSALVAELRAGPSATPSPRENQPAPLVRSTKPRIQAAKWPAVATASPRAAAPARRPPHALTRQQRPTKYPKHPWKKVHPVPRFPKSYPLRRPIPVPPSALVDDRKPVEDRLLNAIGILLIGSAVAVGGSMALLAVTDTDRNTLPALQQSAAENAAPSASDSASTPDDAVEPAPSSPVPGR